MAVSPSGLELLLEMLLLAIKFTNPIFNLTWLLQCGFKVVVPTYDMG